ncbi:glycoside hydrolase family 28 protein [Asticcacaulis sp. 201]|uniref:rhamnogalacturonidase n=1 Tax=Asticcacaulis sp. 201 TaxID=3028787 RepID=UPI002916E3C5|nr:glycosyl hydrolase family 28-related protein [Asticcacaulis sp. 201]MDV6330371.1 glycosyl hydrolase family 28-related protein [Asticcacaulis sp. 201]
MIRRSLLAGAASLIALPARAANGLFDVRDFGARGDGVTVDSPAINRAVAAAVKAGGGTVLLPAGRYLSFSIRLFDNITLLLAEGCVLEAADPVIHTGGYDLAEADLPEQFQDFGITQFHCSLIYADGADHVSVIGRGLIHGKGLVRDDPGARWHGVTGWTAPRSADPKEIAMQGKGIRALGLKNCRNVLVRDITILQGGHFACHLLGCSNATIDTILVDTDRDGIDIDCCRDVQVLNCRVNAPKDDAIVVKSSYALGRKIVSENISITQCRTSGFVMGSVLDGTYRLSDYRSVDDIGVLGRIKLGTESNGGFRNIRISDCDCENTRGILVGVVDGGVLEDVLISNIALRNPVNHPLFVRQAARLRAPEGTSVGACRRVRFDSIQVSGADGRYPCGVQGIPDAPVMDVSFRDVHVVSSGGGTAEDAARTPKEKRESSLEVSFMGTLPAYGLYARNVRGLALTGCTFEVEKPDARPAIVLDDVKGGVINGFAPNTVIQKNGSNVTTPS